jgi:hypothetical protein
VYLRDGNSSGLRSRLDYVAGRQICLNWTTSTSVRQRLLHEETPPSVLKELWVETIEMARLEDVGRSLMAVAVKQSAYEIYPHVVLE